MDFEIKPKADILFEISWEVCNKVGGIYTVVVSKASQMLSYYKENYFLIGPYFSEKARGQFQEIVPPDDIKGIFSRLEQEGIKCHYGKWLIEGEPKTILIDFADFFGQKNQIRNELWETSKIDTLNSGFDFDEPMIFSWASAKLIEQFILLYKDKKIVCQFHEWLCAAGLIYLKNRNLKTGLVFTTHATRLGRTLAELNLPLYSMLEGVDSDQLAYKYNIYDKHQLEKAAAQASHVFTTVSEITGIEAQYILSRKPDFFLFNGLDISKFPSFEEIVIKHRIQRDRIREFILYYFTPYYSFDVKETLLYTLHGRYEFRNKGIDLYIKALGQLNQKLKTSNNSQKTIVAFIFVPSNVRGIKPGLLEAREIYKDIKDYYEEISEELKQNILYNLVSNRNISQSELFTKTFLREIKSRILRLKKTGLPPVSTHDLADPNDIILKAIKEAGLENKEEDKVKIIFYPIYLTGDDGLLHLNYYESIQGSHLGVFPSFYEPWGYTTLEAAALGVSSVTTDLSGFGRFFKEENQDQLQPGIFILDRFGKQDDEVTDSLSDFFYRFSQFSHQDRVKNKLRAREMAAKADWSILIKNYIQAHNLALEKSL